MADWGLINQRIVRCRRSADALSCLQALFDESPDGHVAMAIGEEYESRSALGDAASWFARAAELYPRPAYKNRARHALERVRSRIVVQPSAAPVALQIAPSELHVVSCSKSKAWDSPAERRTFIPARDAYQGEEIRRWLTDPRSRSARWLILSAKYGFIEPDHPIAAYDVTFNDPTTGPITTDSLRAQVNGQTRWADQMRLRDFTRVVVHGGRTYVDKCRQAFGGTSAAVVTPATAPTDLRAPEPQRLKNLVVCEERCLGLGRVLSGIPAEVFSTFDRQEPEWPVLEAIASWRHPWGVLTTLALGLTDYQLGAGGAAAYWREASRLIGGIRPEAESDILRLIEALVRTPVAARLAEAKVERIKRLVRSRVPEYLRRTSMEAIGQSPMELWLKLAEGMEQRTDAKTIVFAMKLFDLLHLAAFGRYAMFPADVVLPVDLRIARLTFAAGLLTNGGECSVDDVSRAPALLEQHGAAPFLDAWRCVGRASLGTSLFRIDSLGWQVAEDLSADLRNARAAVEGRLRGAGCATGLAEQVARELTAVLP